jgi:hypothetical protein
MSLQTGRKNIVANFAAVPGPNPNDVLFNPSKGELQAHFDAVHAAHGPFKHGDAILIGTTDKEGNHAWSSGVQHRKLNGEMETEPTHLSIASAIPRPYSMGRLHGNSISFVREDGKFRGDRVPPGLGPGLRPPESYPAKVN